MYGIYLHMYHTFKPHVDKYAIHGVFGIYLQHVVLLQGGDGYNEARKQARDQLVAGHPGSSG